MHLLCIILYFQKVFKMDFLNPFSFFLQIIFKFNQH